MPIASSTGVRYVARVSEEEAQQLRDLRRGAVRVHRSMPASHPSRQHSQEFSELLARLHRRGVPIDVLATISGVSHQAVRSRIETVELAEVTVDLSKAKTVKGPDGWEAKGLVLVADSGLHRRLLVHANPTVVPYILMVPEIPVLANLDDVLAWLETTSEDYTGTSASSTPLRTPPAVGMSRGLLDEALVELTPTTT